ncbi:type I methionyl aminopeptidase [endosymbiont GvMRE of Glomus versiforme]|uniref:type I methionyl aminopeptidase n=1 Tax=endosymbiont GvMRE of Glomus versiforme TaxID=2039283 RepID=UPI000EE8E43E|nr:type I methionyl aminopeptidase [endosymbiont GvMRE of Glomus versiforme]RHZ37584.1 Methionine aminopeptidase [endosymbiont GvMRE of Glomus versiforme]
MELQELLKMRKVGQVVADILKTLKKEIKIGMTGQDLAQRAQQLMKEKKVKSSIKGYLGFPAAICVSLNNELTHGIPDHRPFKEGDLISFDVACHLKDEKGIAYHADAAMTVLLSEGKEKDSEEKEKLILITKNALQKVIENIKPNITTTQDIGKIIEEYVQSQGYHPVKEYGGHGIGRFMHESPFIPNYKISSERSVVIRENTAICVEPLVQIGSAEIKLSPNNWTVLSAQGQLNAHFEHTIWVGEEKVEVLTNYNE